MSVGFARGDLEPAGKLGTGQSHDDFIADLKVIGAADDPLHTRGVNAFALQGLSLAVWHDLYLAPVDSFAVGVFFWGFFQDLPHHDRAGQFKSVDVFFLKPHFDEVRHEIFGGSICWQLRIFTQPRQWDTHVLTKSPFQIASRTARRLQSCRAYR